MLTAAHCTTQGVYQVAIGVDKLSKDTSESCVEKIRVKKVVDHPSYNGNTLENDITLLELVSDSDYAPIKLAAGAVASALETTGTSLTVAGWGAIRENGPSSDEALAVDVPVVSQSQCNNWVGGIKTGMMCAGLEGGGKDSCQGDSGGPLFGTSGDTTALAGVVSWGYGCAGAQSPGVYTRVSKYLEWVCEKTKQNDHCSRSRSQGWWELGELIALDEDGDGVVDVAKDAKAAEDGDASASNDDGLELSQGATIGIIVAAGVFAALSFVLLVLLIARESQHRASASGGPGASMKGADVHMWTTASSPAASAPYAMGSRKTSEAI